MLILARINEIGEYYRSRFEDVPRFLCAHLRLVETNNGRWANRLRPKEIVAEHDS